ncbi:MAG: hypothetical protein V9G19_26330 [Tetrasphaera sp.]
MSARPVVLTDTDILAALTPEIAVDGMRAALRAHATGHHVTPPRVHAQLSAGRLIYTAGEAPGRWFGYRSYDSFGRDPGEQVVVLHDAGTGRVRAVAIGTALGPLRTGAIDAVELHALARPDASRLALIGTGIQAWTQLWDAGPTSSCWPPTVPRPSSRPTGSPTGLLSAPSGPSSKAGPSSTSPSSTGSTSR